MPNDLLRAARLRMPSPADPARPMSRQELAEAVNAYIYETTKRIYALEAHYVGRLERGTRRWPNDDYRAGFRAVLNADSDAALGFRQPRRRGERGENGAAARLDGAGASAWFEAVSAAPPPSCCPLRAGVPGRGCCWSRRWLGDWTVMEDAANGVPLAGGFVNEVLRVGDTVRRTPPERAGFVERLLRHFERCGWDGAPRYLGVDGQGRQVLSFVDGQVPWRRGPLPPQLVRDAALVATARLVRRFHDLTAGDALAGGAEVVCHNDLSPKNTVYRDGGAGPLPVAILDWDLAAPGARIHDVAHVCWQYLGLGPDAGDPAVAGWRIRVVADAYTGLAPVLPNVDAGELVDTVLWWQDRCWRGIESAADAGAPAMVRLREAGVAGQVRAAYRWTATHRRALCRTAP